MVLIDTSCWIELHRRDGAPEVKLAMSALLEEFEATLCGPVEMEYLGGARPSERGRLQAWLNVIPYLPNDQKLWRMASKNYARLRQEGFTLPWNDVLIGTLSLQAECRIYTVDRHFSQMAPILGIMLYQPGYNGAFQPD